MDGHNSHINLKFIDYADRNRILLAVLPPHSTHRLQPLDVDLFSPLGTYYSQEVDNLLTKSQGLIGMTKRHFWALFREAWGRAFTTKNIEAAWKATGMHPFDPDKVIAPITRRETTPPERQRATAKTPMSADSMVHSFNQLHEKGHIDMEALPLLRVGVKLATDIKILRREIANLRETIKVEKKKRKRGKAMGLYDECGSPSQPLFFSPAKVAQVRQRAERQHKEAAEEKKHQAARAREQKALEKAERAAERVAK